MPQNKGIATVIMIQQLTAVSNSQTGALWRVAITKETKGGILLLNFRVTPRNSDFS